MDSTMLIVGNVPQYFFDNVVIVQTQDLTRTVHSPTKIAGPLIKKDRPWEQTLYFTVNGWSVLRDEKSGKFSCWYEDWHIDPDEVKRQKSFYVCFSATSYAKSDDGLNWKKPELDYYEKDGRKTNIVLGDPSSFVKCESIGVFEDPLDPDPEKRLKIMLDHVLYDRAPDGVKTSGFKAGQIDTPSKVVVEMHSSRDGLRWTPAEKLPRFGQHGNLLGDCFTVFSDVDAGVYRLLTRAAGMESIH